MAGRNRDQQHQTQISTREFDRISAVMHGYWQKVHEAQKETEYGSPMYVALQATLDGLTTAMHGLDSAGIWHEFGVMGSPGLPQRRRTTKQAAEVEDEDDGDYRNREGE